MDGVITGTAAENFSAWKISFDDYMRQRREGGPFAPFTHEDYLATVDGRPRYEGVASFLRSRGIEIPFGDLAELPFAEIENLVVRNAARKAPSLRMGIAEP
ncbi:MAG: hypothetical protein KGL97_14550 [Alphaproteobacteria bacterium]|nr:hypothetical protein [Alphaproteobacteria bacterium]